jgi:uncharacterized protein with HEPN domain
MNRNDWIRLRHMLDAAREAISFTAGRTRADLEVDRMLVLALVKEIEIVGEAASQISQEARAQMPRIPWPDIVGMRHRLVHAYFDINLEILWQTVQGDLPPLVVELERLVRAAPDGEALP